jgi:hypothetical protein
MELQEKVVNALRAGDADGALSFLASAAAIQIADDQRQAYRAMAFAIKGLHADATAGFHAAMNQAPSAARRLTHGSNFAAYLIRRGASDDLAELARQNWRLGELSAKEPLDNAALRNLAEAMERAGHFGFVADVLSPLSGPQQGDRTLTRICLTSLCRTGSAALALDELRRCPEAWRQSPEFLAIESFALLHTGRYRESIEAGKAFVRHVPPLVLKAEPSQRQSLVIIARPPVGETYLKPALDQYFTGNYPDQIASKYSQCYRTAAVFAGAGTDAVGKALSIGPTVVINNFTNAEFLKNDALYDDVCATESLLGLPVINPARLAIRTSRQENALRLARLAGAVVPRVQRFRLHEADKRDLARAIQAEFAFPFIVRLVGPQESLGMFLVEDRVQLDQLLPSIVAPHIYVIEFRGKRQPNGYFRKMRAAFVKGLPTIMRADYHTHWNVRTRKYKEFRDLYSKHPELLGDANDIVMNPLKRLGKSAMDCLVEIGRIIPLDIFGVDFDVNGEGRLVFFEANATMNLLSTAPPDIDYPESAEREFMADVQKLLDRMRIPETRQP